MVNFSPLAAEICPVVWGTPANFATIGLTTGWVFVYTIKPVVKPVVQPE